MELSSVKNLNASFGECGGGWVEVVGSNSWPHLRIELRPPLGRPLRTLMCMMPSFIYGPFRWNDCDLTACRTLPAQQASHSDRLRIMDSRSGFELRCLKAYFVEAVGESGPS
jgi:hypothetical protein